MNAMPGGTHAHDSARGHARALHFDRTEPLHLLVLALVFWGLALLDAATFSSLQVFLSVLAMAVPILTPIAYMFVLGFGVSNGHWLAVALATAALVLAIAALYEKL